MGKRKHRDPAEREARQARRAERADRSIQRQVEQIAAAEYAARLRHTLLHDIKVNPDDIVKLDAEGTVGKRAHTVGTPTPEKEPCVCLGTGLRATTSPDGREVHGPGLCPNCRGAGRMPENVEEPT